MNPFHLLQQQIDNPVQANQADPSRRTRVGRQEFPTAVRSAGWLLLQPGGALVLPDGMPTIAVAVATWSRPEIAALAMLYSRQSMATRQICALDIDACLNPGDFEQLLPDVPPPTQTPVVALYSNQGLEWWLQGKKARTWIETGDANKNHPQ